MTRENYVRVECELAGQTLTIETGHIARQAHGSCLVTLGDTQCFAAAAVGPARDDLDFFPLTVDYREKTDAAGKIPGGFFKREGRPTTKEILTMRLIDRSIRPLFPKGFRQEVQVQSRVFGYDGENPSDILAMIASFAALHISNIPFECALGAIRIGMIDDKLVSLPTDAQKRGESSLDLVVSGHEEAIVMVEASAEELPEAEIIDALEFAHSEVRKVVACLEELRAKAGKEKLTFTPPSVDSDLEAKVGTFRAAMKAALETEGKAARSAAVSKVKDEAVEACQAMYPDDPRKVKEAKNLLGDLSSALEREQIVSGRRVDGRRADEIRKITIEPNFIRRNHGSALFTRGETQAIVSCTLGTPADEQIIDGIEEEYKKHFYLHYSFPPFSVGEVRRIMGPGRREIGHGMLAERAIAAVLPSKDTFPYTLRVVSEILESNGSSSMASVCGGCLALMLAGVPLTQPVAGIAMGLIQENGKTVILSDILGSEDHNGDMDFKVAGSGRGITALQMDIKITGVTRELLEDALAQAREGRVWILRQMLSVVDRPSPNISEFAPRMERLQVPEDRIGFLIGPGGKNIKGLQEQYKAKITVEDDGHVTVAGLDGALIEACVRSIQAMCETPKVGARYKGTVKSVKDFGAFIEILPGTEGMCHISELAEGFVERVDDVVSVGDEIEVVVIGVDDRGKVKLSHKQTLAQA